jgi:hypothetical protein
MHAGFFFVDKIGITYHNRHPQIGHRSDGREVILLSDGAEIRGEPEPGVGFTNSR